MLNLTRTADYLGRHLEALGFVVISKGNGEGLPLVAFRLDPKGKKHYDEFAVAHQLRERGWVVPAYTMAPHSEKLKLMRVVVREDFSRGRCDALIVDVKMAVEHLDSLDEGQVKAHQEQVKRQAGHKLKGVNGHFKGMDDHSLQGKHEKSHPVF